MNRTKTNLMVGMFGIAAVGLMAATQGCSSTSSSGGTGGGGGHIVTGSGGSDGGSLSDGSAACTKITTPLIADFGADGGAGLVTGGAFAFQQSPLMPATFDTSTGALKATFNTGAPTGMYPYAGFGLGFPTCSDVTAFTGVKFNISGTLSAGCTIQFSLTDRVHTTLGTGFGTCTVANGCYAGNKGFTLPATPTDMTILFSDITTAGVPATPIVSPDEATGVQWQLNVAGGDGSGGCVGDVTIDNVTLVP
jgi:hypothetical protein